MNLPTAATVLWTSPKILNNESNYFSSDDSPRYDETCRKSPEQNRKQSKSPCNSRQTSSNFSKASHLNLSKYMQDSQMSFDNDNEYVQTHTPTLAQAGNSMSQQSIKDEVIETANNHSEQIKAQKSNVALNNQMSRILNPNQKSLSPLQQKIQNQEKKVNSPQQRSEKFFFKSKNMEEREQLNSKKQQKKGLKSPLTYQNLIKSLAKYTKLENDLLEETMLLEKEIQNSQEQINQLLSTSNREQSVEQQVNNTSHQESSNRQIPKTSSLLSLQMNQSIQKNSIMELENKNNPDCQDEGVVSQTNKPTLLSEVKITERVQQSNGSKGKFFQINSNYKYLQNGNISQRSKKNRFHDNIMKLRQFQQELQKEQKEEGNQSKEQKQMNNSNCSQHHQTLGSIHLAEEPQPLSSWRVVEYSTSPFIKEKNIKKLYKFDKEVNDSSSASNIPINSGNLTYALLEQGCSNYFQNGEKVGQSSTQDIVRTSSFIQKCSNESFPFHIFSAERLQKSSSTKSIEKIEKEKFQNYFVQSQNTSKLNKSEMKQYNFGNSSINSSHQRLQQSQRKCVNLSKADQPLNTQSSEESTQKYQQAKSNKKLEILNLLSRINNKQAVPPSPKLNISYSSFDRVNIYTPNDIVGSVTANQTTCKIQHQAFPSTTDSLRKSSPQHNKKQFEESSDSRSSFTSKMNGSQIDGIQKSSKQGQIQLKNSLTETLKMLLSSNNNGDQRSLTNKNAPSKNRAIPVSGPTVTSINNQNSSMKSLLQHIFNKSCQQNEILKK